MKILLFYVAGDWGTFKANGAPEAVCLSHALMTFASTLKKAGHDHATTDTRSYGGIDKVEVVAKGLQFDAVFVWVQAGRLELGKSIVQVLRRTGHKTEPIVVGGPAASSGRFTDFPGANAVIHGEPEVGWERALNAPLGDEPVVIDTMSAPLASLDSLPENDTSIANVEYEKSCSAVPGINAGVYTLTVGRSCPACYDADIFGYGFRCQQCNPVLGDGQHGSPRLKSPEKFVDEVYRLNGSHGTGGIGRLVVHDGFIATLDWLRKMTTEWIGLIRRIPIFFPINPSVVTEDPFIIRDLARIGMTWVGFDVGSFVQRQRDVLGIPRSASIDEYAVSVAKTYRLNISLKYFFGVPGQTEQELDEQEKMVRKLEIQHHDYRYFRPTPGHRSFKHCLEKGLLSNERDPALPFDPPTVNGVNHSLSYRRFKTWRESHAAPVINLPWDSGHPAVAQQRQEPSTSPPSFRPAPVRTATSTTPSTQIPNVPLRIDQLLQRDTKPKITVILLSYNRPDFLREAFHSIEGQTISKDLLECIIVENGSSDPRVKEFVDYKDNPVAFPWVKVIRHDANINNVAVCWNEALLAASGDYVCTLDDDNRKLPEFCEKSVAFLDANPDKDAVFCQSRLITKAGVERGFRPVPVPFTLEQELRGNRVDSGELVFRRSLIDRIGYFDDRCKACEDWDFIARITHYAKGVGCLPEVLTEYRTHDENRLHTSVDLGAAACTELLRSKHQKDGMLSVKLVYPVSAELTVSQNQVISGIKDSIRAIPFVKVSEEWSSDIVIVTAPFRLGENAITSIKKYVSDASPRPKLVTLHMEDPQATVANGRLLGAADWIVANDIAAMEYYRKKFLDAKDDVHARQILCWNSLGLSEKARKRIEEKAGTVRDIDVCFFGYPYPTRLSFVRDFVKNSPTTWKMVAVGDGWRNGLAGLPVSCLETQDEISSIDTLLRTKIVVVTHRTGDDAGGFPTVLPSSIHRGFIEASCGCAVVLDDARKFGAGKLKFFHAPTPLVATKHAWDLLKDPKKLADLTSRNREIALKENTMTTRLTRLLNMIRSEFWNGTVK